MQVWSSQSITERGSLALQVLTGLLAIFTRIIIKRLEHSSNFPLIQNLQQRSLAGLVPGHCGSLMTH